MTEKERFTVDSDGKYWDKINHRYVNLDYLFRLVEELDIKLDNKEYIINEMAKTIRIYDDGYIDLNKKYNKVVDENKQLKEQNEHFLNIINCLKKSSCKSTNSFIDSYYTDKLLNEYGLNEENLFHGDYK